MHDIYTHEHSLQQCVEIASRLTIRTASAPIWRQTNKRTRQLVCLAKQLADEGRPYLISSLRELCEKYPDITRLPMRIPGPDYDQKRVWAIWSSVIPGSSRLEIGFMPIR